MISELFVCPNARWEPLNRAVLRFHRSSNQAKSVADLIQMLCDAATREHEDFRFEYYDGLFSFFIEQENSEGEDLTLGSFQIGDLTPRIQKEVSVSDTSYAAMAKAMLLLHQFLEAALHLPQNVSSFRLFARVGSPLAHTFQEIPPDVFLHFGIIDWRAGVAKSGSNEFLYSLFFEPRTEAVGIQPDAPQPIDANTRTADFARFLRDFHESGKPAAVTWGALVSQWIEVRGYDAKTTLTEKSLRAALRVAIDAKQLPAGVP